MPYQTPAELLKRLAAAEATAKAAVAEAESWKQRASAERQRADALEASARRAWALAFAPDRRGQVSPIDA